MKHKNINAFSCKFKVYETLEHQCYQLQIQKKKKKKKKKTTTNKQKTKNQKRNMKH